MAHTLSLPQAQINSGLKVLGGSLLIALCAQIAIPLPFTPVPLALGSMAPLFLGAALGKKHAFWAVLLYLLEGAMGLPVFAFGYRGIARFFGPSGGYLIGYALAAYLVGYLVEKSSSPRRTVLAMIAGSSVILLCGAMHLASLIGMKAALFAGVLPFLAGDLILKPLVAFLALKKRI